MVINYLQTDKKLCSYIEKNRCSLCGNKILNKTMILQDGGEEDKCYSCNVKEGNIQ